MLAQTRFQLLSPFAAVCGLVFSVTMAQPALAGGWVNKLPTKVVQPDSGRRNHVFYVGDPISFRLAGEGVERFEVRDYWGNVIDQGPAKDTIAIKATKPGWYKLYIYGQRNEPAAASPQQPNPQPGEPTPEQLWGDCLGATTFVILRDDAHFPKMPAKDGPDNARGVPDEVVRGVVGMGPQRHRADTGNIDQAIKDLEFEVALDRKYYLGRDPERKRALMAAFPNGTKDLAGVRAFVEHFKRDIQYWEPRNEPNYGASGADFVNNELKPFYETVKAVDPQLKVLGPGTVGIGPQLQPWLEDFLAAGGAKHVDAFSFHIYNGINGDLWLARKSMDSLAALLKKHGAEKLERWQTEQGYFACVYGAYQPRLQARWTMLELMVFEQYGLPKEHNHLWYDRSHGFWDFPTWWENDDGGLNPIVPLVRVWSEELFGTRFVERFDFGPAQNRMLIGSRFEGPQKQVAVFQSAGSTDGRVAVRVRGADALRLVSAFGSVSSLPVVKGEAVIPVDELPVYVEPAEGQSLEVVPADWGDNLARAAGVTVSSSGKPEHPVDAKIDNSTSKIVNGELENWYWSQQPDAHVWMSNVERFPAWVELGLGKQQSVGRVTVFATPPWQWQGTLLDYELQYRQGNDWVTLEHVKEPAQTFQVFTAATRTSVDSFFSDRWVFHHEFKPVTTDRLRLLVHETTWGGGATEAVTKAGGQTGPHQITLREIEVYAK